MELLSNKEGNNAGANEMRDVQADGVKAKQSLQQMERWRCDEQQKTVLVQEPEGPKSIDYWSPYHYQSLFSFEDLEKHRKKEKYYTAVHITSDVTNR